MIRVESSIKPQPIKSKILKDAAQAALNHQAANGDIVILLTDDKKLHQLNREFLGIDRPTDVLSFPASETDPETGDRYLGDIIISIERAQEQAHAAKHPLEAEAQLLIVHGILHLLGYDHANAKEKTKMWKVQGEILESLGLGKIQIREE